VLFLEEREETVELFLEEREETVELFLEEREETVELFLEESIGEGKGEVKAPLGLKGIDIPPIVPHPRSPQSL